MRIKDIKQEMSIHCKNDEEKSFLLKEAERLGYVWYRTKRKPTERNVTDTGNTIHFYDAGTNNFSVDYKHITHSCLTGDSVIEFSDLILPELSAEEVLSTIKEICASSNTCNDMCLLCDGNGCVIRKTEFDVKKVIEICSQWKSDHEKKEPETEWMWQGRIVNANNMELLQCFDTGCEYRESAEEYMKDELKEYCKTHDGEFIATVEHICRVKAVE